MCFNPHIDDTEIKNMKLVKQVNFKLVDKEGGELFVKTTDEDKFVEYLENFDRRIEVMENAFHKVNKLYSFEAVYNKFNRIIE